MPVFTLGLFRSVVRRLRAFRVRPLNNLFHSEASEFSANSTPGPPVGSVAMCSTSWKQENRSHPKSNPEVFPVHSIGSEVPELVCFIAEKQALTDLPSHHGPADFQYDPARAHRQAPLVPAIIQGSANL